MPEMNEYRRGFHYIFTWKLALSLGLGLLASNALFYLLAAKPLQHSYAEAIYTLQHSSQEIQYHSIWICGVMLILVGALVYFASLLMSHRISGPVYRFEKSAESMAGGDFSIRVRIREKDEMKPLAAEMDNYLVSMRERISEIKKISEEMEKASTSESAMWNERLKEKLSFFKT